MFLSPPSTLFLCYFYSNPVSPNQSFDFPAFEIIINDTNPIWGYCSQKNHCDQGMVFSINANETSNQTFADFLALALQSNIANPTIPEIEGGELITSTSTAAPIRHTMIVGSTSGSLT